MDTSDKMVKYGYVQMAIPIVCIQGLYITRHTLETFNVQTPHIVRLANILGCVKKG